jgi:hypothetical protein
MARSSIGREQFDLWDKFEFVGDSYDGRKLWAVGQGGNGVMVADLVFDGELTPDNLPDDAGVYPQRFLSGRKGLIFRKAKNTAA